MEPTEKLLPDGFLTGAYPAASLRHSMDAGSGIRNEGIRSADIPSMWKAVPGGHTAIPYSSFRHSSFLPPPQASLP